jgi:hypothetical protein
MGGRLFFRAHFAELDVEPELGNLPGGFRAGEPGTYDDKIWLLHSGYVGEWVNKWCVRSAVRPATDGLLVVSVP